MLAERRRRLTLHAICFPPPGEGAPADHRPRLKADHKSDDRSSGHTGPSGSGIAITQHWMPREDLLQALDKRLELLPSKVIDSRTITLGSYKGLEFGVILHPDGNPNAYLKGQATRCLRLHAPKFGPRALITAFSRLE